MKKNLFIISFVIIAATIMLPLNTLAKIETSNLVEAVNEEINLFQNEDSYKDAVGELKSYNLENYKDSNDKVNVYLFRGSTCSHCFEAISFFAKIYEEYGEYFNFKSYEVWSNTDNNDLMQKVGKKLGKDISGVPFIIIGKKTYSGYTENYNDDIIKAIKKEYKKDKEDRIDVIKTLNLNENNVAGDIISVLIIILIAVGITFGIIKLRKNS